jgi:hypothetical protein
MAKAPPTQSASPTKLTPRKQPVISVFSNKETDTEETKQTDKTANKEGTVDKIDESQEEDETNKEGKPKNNKALTGTKGETK